MQHLRALAKRRAEAQRIKCPQCRAAVLRLLSGAEAIASLPNQAAA